MRKKKYYKSNGRDRTKQQILHILISKNNKDFIYKRK